MNPLIIRQGLKPFVGLAIPQVIPNWLCLSGAHFQGQAAAGLQIVVRLPDQVPDEVQAVLPAQQRLPGLKILDFFGELFPFGRGT